jgi:hypothetical protein
VNSIPDSAPANSQARPEPEVFAELSHLCSSPGFVYALALVCLENNLVYYRDRLKPDDLLSNYSHESLIRTELSTLFGLLVKTPVDFNYQGDATTASYAQRSVQLLAELHEGIKAPMERVFRALAEGSTPEKEFSRGEFLREAIFYGAESAYLFQYMQLTVPKYAADNSWLSANRGFTIQDAHAVLSALLELLPTQISSSLAAARGGDPIRATMECLTLDPRQIVVASGLPPALVDTVITAFSVPADERNTSFATASDFNIVNATPLLRHPDGRVTVFHSMSVGEALYETPFFWMTTDKTYFNTIAQANRGDFLEEFCSTRLKSVFGSDRTYPNVKLIDAGGTVDGEIDVLVLYGNRALIVQAKSKRLTLAARKGLDANIQEDFAKSVQKAYDQGADCARRLLASTHTLRRPDGTTVSLRRQIERAYVVCVLSDHYPALAFQARNMIKLQTVSGIEPPFVMDLFFLDELTEFLSDPLHFMSYIDRRVGYYDRIIASHEHILLAYHLKKNLWLDSATSMMHLTDDVAVELDIAMLARRAGADGPRTPGGILSLGGRTAVGRIIKLLEKSDDSTAIDLGLMLLTLDEDSVKQANQNIDRIITRARRDRKTHDFSMSLKGQAGGITVHCGNEEPASAKRRLVLHCAKRKYLAESDTWFGAWLGPGVFEVRAVASLVFKWQLDNEMLEAIHRSKPAPYPSSGVAISSL